MSSIDRASPGDPGPESPVARIPFSDREHQTIVAMARYMALAGVLGVVIVVFNLVASVVQAFVLDAAPIQLAWQACGMVFMGLVMGVLALFLFQAAQSFRAVVETDEADQSHLVHALGRLRLYFVVKGVIYIAALLVMCCLAGLVLVLGMAVVSQGVGG